MNYIERGERTIRLAKERGDKAALAILEADRRFTPDPETPMLTGGKACPECSMGPKWGPLPAVTPHAAWCSRRPAARAEAEAAA